ncbi:MAG TPA: peptidoglycan-binding domain-containing protein, partial [Baekduia sp.]|nr:peptidoglycan-binding domain-containing protein [Baekduia sp.]
MARLALSLALPALLLTAAPAGAQEPPAAPPAPAPTTAPAPTLAITPERVGGSRAVVLAGTRFRVRGVVTPAVAGEQVTVRFYRGTRRIARRTVTLLASPTGRSSYFVLGFRSTVPGRIRIEATKPAGPQAPTLKAAPRGVTVLPLRVRPGSRGPAVRELQRMLRAKGYVTGAPGLFDARTARAVLAFRKVTGMARTYEAGPSVFRRLARGGGTFRVRFPQHGRHVEADIS